MGNEENKFREESFHSEHPFLSDAKIVTQEDRKYIQANFNVLNEEHEFWAQRAQMGRKGLKEDYLFLPRDSWYQEDLGFCSESGTLTNSYPYYPYQLSGIIRERKNSGQFFSEGELWYLLWALSSAKNALPANRMGEIKPENVFVNPNGQFKIGNVYSWPNQQSAYMNAFYHKQGPFTEIISPQDIDDMRKPIYDNYRNQKSELFAIGATVLCAGNLDTMVDVYDMGFKSKSFNEAALFSKKRTWVSAPRYSDDLKAVVLNLLKTKPEERMFAVELHQMLTPYEQAILHRQQFKIQSVPNSLTQTYQNFKRGVI